jgi:tRNA nucleotidyltransferase (CCA-adding enzyme)
MHIILTHEQADFDAIASLFGAHLVSETAVPVLPRRMNRNVRGFITLYGAELPFMDPRDLTGERIDEVTLVDTQSLISIKGMGAYTRVMVIDHHPVRDDLPGEWQVTTEDVGATATLFVEALRERDSPLSTIQSTLLLLGIYEDTGSLTYTRTTPRDLNAAAYLLSHGASLEIAADFLNHPLSFQQQALYDDLWKEAKTYHVQGHTIVVACGKGQDVDEEFSSVVHKLRDLLDPDALFALLAIRGGVQMIARSTSDDIDVSKLAEHFGGGGHERAAAALIKDRDLKSVCDELVQILERHVRPAITVANIMSPGPQLVSPDTPAADAALKMQRYGFEGYPVVKDGKVIGLLTRRAVDRALSHEFNLSAERLMEAGSVSVESSDSIEQLQRVMTESGWGQIPVVNPQSGEIIGIVTRTDLLKTLTQGSRVTRLQNLASKLESALPPARLALIKAVARVAYEQRAALYIVGGPVRDLLLDRPSQDFDFVVEGDAIDLARSLSQTYGGRVTSHSQFGTAKWHIAEIHEGLIEALERENRGVEWTAGQEPPKLGTRPGRPPAIQAFSRLDPGDLPDSLDLITARTEFYTHPSALPTVERGSIKLDLHRRDFTINTLALRLDGHHYGELHDYWGGLNDLKEGLVRVLHSLSFVDDPTRILRAVRFEGRFGFNIEQRTLDLLLEARQLLDRVSGDRIRHELDHILQEDKVCRILARFHELGLLAAIHPELSWDDWLCEKFEVLQQPGPLQEWGFWETEIKGRSIHLALAYIMWTIRMRPGQVQAVIDRLKIPLTVVDAIFSARRLCRELPVLAKALPSRVVARLGDKPPLALYAGYLASDDDNLKQVVMNYITLWQHTHPTLDGHVLKNRGLPPGPVYREILGALRDAWLDGKITSQNQEKELLDQLLKDKVVEKD